jgi:hypothetical protein
MLPLRRAGSGSRSQSKRKEWAHWPSAYPRRDSERKGNERQIRWVAGKLVNPADNQLAISG